MGWLLPRGRTAYGLDHAGAASTDAATEGSGGRLCGVDGGCGAGGGDGGRRKNGWKGTTVDRLGHGRMGVLNEPNDVF